MSGDFTFLVDIAELAGLSEKEAYNKGLANGLEMSFETEENIAAARSEVIAYGLAIHEKWEKTQDFIYVLAHEYVRGLNHGLQQNSEKRQQY